MLERRTGLSMEYLSVLLTDQRDYAFAAPPVPA